MIDLLGTSHDWSFTKHKTFVECKRKSVLAYQITELVRKGKLKGELGRKVFRLSKMTSLDLIFGNSLHNQIYQAIKSFFNDGVIPNREEIELSIRYDMNLAVKQSLQNQAQWEQNPREYTVLQEIYYNKKLPEVKVAKIKEKLEQCVGSFFDCLTLQEIFEHPNIRFDQAERFRAMVTNGVKVRVVMDLVYDNIREGKKVLVDWKSSVNPSIDDYYQLCVYALYFNNVFKVPIEEIEVRNEYLYQQSAKSYPVTKDDLERVKELISQSFRSMYQFVIDLELKQVEDVLYIEGANSEKVCEMCNFRELCCR